MNKDLNSIGLDKKPSDTTVVVACRVEGKRWVVDGY